MRVRVAPPSAPLSPGQPAAVSLEVTNSFDVIDGVAVSVDADLGLAWSAQPPLLALFPDTSGTVTVTFTASRSVPAGQHLVPLQLRSTATGTVATVEVPLIVAPTPGLAVTAVPAERSGRSRARFQVICDNTGNTPLDVDLAAVDASRTLRTSFTPTHLQLPPGSSAGAQLEVRGRRRLLGTEVVYPTQVVADAGEVDGAAVQSEAATTFRQQPVLPRGARTAMLLGAIVLVWAAVVVIALQHALSSNPLTKQAPASFYADHGAALAAGRLPPGAVPKTGTAIGLGGTLSGTVDAGSTGAGVGRITVQAWQVAPGGLVLGASTASASNGSWSIPGLMPGSYLVELSAQGYRTVWYPSASSAAGAKQVPVSAAAGTSGLHVDIAGDPGSITGTVRTIQSPPPTVTVTVLPKQGATTTPIATVTTNAQGSYSIPNLPTPGTYDLSFSAPGYHVGTDTEVLSGGQHDIANTVVLTAAAGSISGTVTAGSVPLGGVTVTAAANGDTFATATPTSGQVGAFTLANLPSPATYLLTFRASGYGTDTVAEQLGPGQNLTGLAVSLVGGAGQVSGTVSDPSGQPLGGVTVTVTGASTPLSTETLTAGQVGTYQLSGLPVPSDVTLTFSLAGYQSVTVPVQLGASGSASGIDATLTPADGTLTGTVTSTSGSPLAGTDVSVTSGATTITTHSTSSPPGRFVLQGLAPGSYSVTVSDSGYRTTTVLVTIAAGQDDTVTVQLPAGSAG